MSDISWRVYRQATGTRLGSLTQAVFTIVLGWLLCFYLNWKLALSAAAFVPLCGLATYIESRHNRGSVGKEGTERQTSNQVTATTGAP